ncbi:hypothetical protein [Legionella tunisiensis]|uniref:hypothetical protein n=1 Tax=Legionella tunisiensis TaxID=1034944 RepID=UPI00031E2482|nr:hypothetical protein [Legionella tunisiensis]
MAVVKLLSEKGLRQFITNTLTDNEDLCRALLLIEHYDPTAINEKLMSDKAISISKMAVVITKLDDFVENYPKQAVKGQLENFRNAAIPVLLTDKNCEAKQKELCTLAKKHFEHQDFPRRVLADVLQFITLTFLFIMPYRAYKGKSLLFSQAETNRESLLKQDVLPALVADKDKDVPENKNDEPKVEL